MRMFHLPWFRKPEQPKAKEPERDEFPVLPPRNGDEFIPPAVFRKYKQVEIAMKADDKVMVRELQLSLVKAGYQAPANISEAHMLRMRLRERQAYAENVLR